MQSAGLLSYMWYHDSVMIPDVDKTDARLLDIIQSEFPLVPRPFDSLAGILNISASEVLSRLLRLKSDHIIRQISAIFDSTALGYHSVLIAFNVKPDHLDSVAAMVARQSGVSHCYSRDAEYNLWFTLTVKDSGFLVPGRELNTFIASISTAGSESMVKSFIILPALKIFKIGVFLSMSDEDNRSHPVIEISPVALSDPDITAVKALQQDLPLLENPFAQLAREIGMSEGELLDRAKAFQENGTMRRFAAVLYHRNAGYTANAMVCWQVEDDRIEEVGSLFSRHRAVSHCYERPAFPDWPYSLYTMIHCRTENELDRTVHDLVQASQITCCRVLHTIHEYKKSRVRYFTEVES